MILTQDLGAYIQISYQTDYADTPLDVMVSEKTCLVDRESVLIDLASSLTLIESIIARDWHTEKRSLPRPRPPLVCQFADITRVERVLSKIYDNVHGFL